MNRSSRSWKRKCECLRARPSAGWAFTELAAADFDSWEQERRTPALWWGVGGMASLPQKKRGLEAKPDIFKALTSLNLKLGGVQVPNQPLEMHLL